MTIVIRIILILIAGLAVLRIVYALGTSERKTNIRAAIDKLMTMLTATVVVYWLYMLALYFWSKRGGGS